MEELKQEIKELKNEISLLRQDIKFILQGQNKMNNHVDFVEAVYSSVRSPLEYIRKRLYGGVKCLPERNEGRGEGNSERSEGRGEGNIERSEGRGEGNIERSEDIGERNEARKEGNKLTIDKLV
jgi:hypothetical protein